MNIHIKLINERVLTIKVSKENTILEIKQLLVNLTEETPVDKQRLIYNGKLLLDEYTIESCGIAENETIHFVPIPITVEIKTIPLIEEDDDLHEIDLNSLYENEQNHRRDEEQNKVYLGMIFFVFVLYLFIYI